MHRRLTDALSRHRHSNWARGSALLLAVLATATTLSSASAAIFNRSTYSSPIALSRNDRLLFSVNPDDNTVSVICVADNQVLATIGVGKDPRSVAVDPNNEYFYVANAASSSVTIIRIIDPSCAGWSAQVAKTIKTGAEPWDLVISPNGKRVFVANSAQDTITVINAQNRTKIGDVDLRDSICNEPDRNRHFQPRGLAIPASNAVLYVTRFLSFTVPLVGQQGKDRGKQGLVCRLNIETTSTDINDYLPAEAITFSDRPTGFNVDSNGDGVPDQTRAFPNQMQSIVIRGNRAFMPNIAASPQGPLVFNVDTQAFVTILTGVGTNDQKDGGALNLHLGARNPEPGKKRLFFANPWAIAFTTQTGVGNAYVVSAGSDLLVKLNVAANNQLSFTVDADTTRYIDLNDPDNPDTAGANAGKNPLGIVINSAGTRAFVSNYVSRNVSVVNLETGVVKGVIQTGGRPPSGSLEEKILVGAEMFFSSRGHFNRPAGTNVSTDERLSSEGWQNCASCHFNGWTDGVIWQFNAGPRKSVNLAGTFNPHQRNQQKVLNYSAIFDEVEDFELNIRNVSGPGNLPAPVDCRNPPPDQSAFNPNQGLIIGDNNGLNRPPCVIAPLAGKANAGRKEVTVDPVGATAAVPALTALKLWVQRGVRVPNGPLTDAELPGGVPADQIAQGRALFIQQGCQNCHGGGLWSSSVKDFASPPTNNQIACEVNLGAAAPVGSFCTTAPVTGDPVAIQYLRRFIKDIGSYNLGVPGQGNPIGANIGAVEKATPALVAGVSQPPKDGLGRDFNNDGRGEGFSPQSLLGIFAVQPYYHNGACETLGCVVSDVNHRTAKGTLPDNLNTAAKRRAVVRFLESIDVGTTPIE
jgi:YVTN family beta-propeller protein